MHTAGDSFGDYDLLGRLGFGGMAELFLARRHGAEGFSKLVALKRILPNYSEDEQFVRMFTDEAVLAAQLSHPNVVHVLNYGTVDGRQFLEMEYVPGTDLGRMLKW